MTRNGCCFTFQCKIQNALEQICVNVIIRIQLDISFKNGCLIGNKDAVQSANWHSNVKTQGIVVLSKKQQLN